MTLIENIIDDLTDTSKTLAAPLLKAKVLASRAENDTLYQWVDAELTGYRDKKVDQIPGYRIAKPNFYCTYFRGPNEYVNQPLPLSIFKEAFIKRLLMHKLDDSVQTMEEQATGESGDLIGQDYGIDLLNYVNDQLIPGARNIKIVQLRKTIHITEVTQALAIIRSKLLDFILQMEKAFPNLDELIKKKIILQPENKEKIERLVHQTIIHAHDGNTIIAGNDNTVKQDRL